MHLPFLCLLLLFRPYINNEEKVLCDLDGDNIFYKDVKEELICNIHDLKLLGIHNYENVMAAVAIAISVSVPLDIIRKAIREFTEFGSGFKIAMRDLEIRGAGSMLRRNSTWAYGTSGI